MLRSGWCVGLVLPLLLAIPAAVSADVPPPDICDEAGSACTFNGSIGVCEQATCTRIDYVSWEPGSDGPPLTASYPCNRCTPVPGGSLGTAGLLGACCCAGLIGLLGVGGAVVFARRKKKA